MDDLHTPLIPILEHVLRALDWPRGGLLLDLASGPGLKLPLLASAAGPGVRLLALDCDVGAVRAAAQVGAALAVAGDAHSLPLRDGSCAAACCIAALGLLADGDAALRELCRAIAPGGPLLVVTAAHAWAQLTDWPAGVAAPLADAYAQALAHGCVPPTSPDLAGELCGRLAAAGFAGPQARAFLLGPAATPIGAELPLLPWPALRSLVAGALPPALLAACDEAAARPEIELCSVALAAWASSP